MSVLCHGFVTLGINGLRDLMTTSISEMQGQFFQLQYLYVFAFIHNFTSSKSAQKTYPSFQS